MYRYHKSPCNFRLQKCDSEAFQNLPRHRRRRFRFNFLFSSTDPYWQRTSRCFHFLHFFLNINNAVINTNKQTSRIKSPKMWHDGRQLILFRLESGTDIVAYFIKKNNVKAYIKKKKFRTLKFRTIDIGQNENFKQKQ